ASRDRVFNVSEASLAVEDMVERGTRAALVTRNDRRLDVPIAVQHVPQHVLQTGQRRLTRDVVRSTNLLLVNQRERLAHRLRRVMEGGFQSYLGVVQPVGVQRHLRSGGAATKKVDCTAAPDHVHGPFPGLWTPHSFDGYVSAATIRSERAYCFDGIVGFGDLHDVIGAEALGRGDLRIALYNRNDVTAGQLRYLNEHQSYGTSAEHG